jgi:glycosyltransferase involved in cell wall biosynthesis
MPKLLIITHHRKDRSPGQRFRFEQYLDFLSANGYEITFSNFINESDDKVFYGAGNLLGKVRVVLKNIFIRISNVLSANKYDAILIYREAFVFGSTIFEYLLSKSKAKLIYDFDDSIWLLDVSTGNKAFSFLKSPDKTKKIIGYCDMITVGNEYLANYARQYNNNVKIIPTTIDTTYHINKNKQTKTRICVGWTGTDTTAKHFEYLLPTLEKLYKKFPNIYFKMICDRAISYPSLNLESTKWNKETEIEQLSEIDVGIMPLPDDKWANGKCGFKGLQYMSLEIATIMSPVGVNTEIIQQGINGFLASTEEEWLDKLTLLIENEELRLLLGKAGRKTIENKYSVKAWENKYLEYYNELVKK